MSRTASLYSVLQYTALATIRSGSSPRAYRNRIQLIAVSTRSSVRSMSKKAACTTARSNGYAISGGHGGPHGVHAARWFAGA